MKNILIILSLFLLTGCALTRDHISLGYEPMTDVQVIPEAEKTAVHVAVADKRVNKDRVGRKVNGYGMPMALIVCDNQVDELVKEALLKELANRGFVTNKDDPQIVVNVDLNKMSNKFHLGFFSFTGRSETILTIKIQNRDGTTAYHKNITGQGIEPEAWLATGRYAKPPLELSLKSAVEHIIQDPEFINALLNHPQAVNAPVPS